MMIKKILHRLAHKFGVNSGRILSDSKTVDGELKYYIGFKCSGCGEEDWHELDPEIVLAKMLEEENGRN